METDSNLKSLAGSCRPVFRIDGSSWKATWFRIWGIMALFLPMKGHLKMQDLSIRNNQDFENSPLAHLLNAVLFDVGDKKDHSAQLLALRPGTILLISFLTHIFHKNHWSSGSWFFSNWLWNLLLSCGCVIHQNFVVKSRAQGLPGNYCFPEGPLVVWVQVSCLFHYMNSSRYSINVHPEDAKMAVSVLHSNFSHPNRAVIQEP